MEDGLHAFRWGELGKCYTYTNERERKLARFKARRQGMRIEESIKERKRND